MLKDTFRYSLAYYRYASGADPAEPYNRVYEVTEQEVLFLKDEARKWRNLALGILNREHGGHK
jgi:hypothetical protein